jgi:hypothetical protein
MIQHETTSRVETRRCLRPGQAAPVRRAAAAEAPRGADRAPGAEPSTCKAMHEGQWCPFSASDAE